GFMIFFLSMLASALWSSLFPYTTLFRSRLWVVADHVAFHPGELFFLSKQRLFGERNQQVTVNLPIDERETAIPVIVGAHQPDLRSEEHTSELQSRSDLVCRLLLEKKKPA